MPTTNPVPSADPSDLLFNAGKLDEVVNGTANSFTDRLGATRRTVAGMNADFDAQLADAESDLNVYRADAAASAAEALGYLQTIRATSYGAYASDPATDPLGNPPTEGDEYWNTTAKLLKRWNGTTWQASDINTANLAATSGSSLIGFDGGTVQDVLDNAKAMQDYTALRAYTGRATGVRITTPGIGGFFQRLGTTGLTDNGGTIIIDSEGRAWERVFNDAVNIRWFGAVHDYSGTPQYDGIDSTRITATDNAAALRAAVLSAIYHSAALYIPDGHFGLKTPATDIDLGGKNLTIYGDGKDQSILDFIYEDESGTVYTTDSAANFMLRLVNGGTVEFRDIQVKATTNKRVVRGLVNSAAAVYYSKIFGVLVKDCTELRLINTRASRFNGKGFATDGITKFRAANINGDYCTWSPYWVEEAADSTVFGGDLSFNGYPGNPSTGYGITFNRDCGVVYVRGVKAHHNYRKGIDTHGTHRYYVKGCDFEDNVFAHVAAVNVQANTGLNNGVLSVTGCTMSNGATADSEAWLRAAYQAAFANGFTDHGHRACILSDGPSQAELLEFIGNTVESAYCGNDVMTSASEGLFYMYSQSGRIFFKDNVMPLKKYGMNSAIINSAYAFTPVHMSAKRYVVDNNHLTYTASSAFTGSNGADFGGAYSFGVTDSTIWPTLGAVDVEFTRNTTILNNAKLLSSASSTSTFPLRFLNDYKFKMHDNITSLMVRKTVNGDNGGWFSDIGYLDQQKASLANNKFIVNGTTLVWDWVRGRVNKNHARSGTGFSKAAGAAAARVIIDGVATLSNIEILAFSGAKPNPVTIWIGSPSSSNSQTGSDANFTYSVNSAYVDSDGVTKIAITISTVNSLSSLCVSASLTSLVESYGIERIDIL